MIHFEKLSFKNFLSIGNNGVTYDFTEGETYMIQGKNGGGKSTIIDALTFVLYGKPFRKINKPQLVNSVNQKNCEVAIKFNTRGRSYQIRRTISPNELRVWEDGKELEQLARVNDFQQMITNQILRMTEPSFRQLVVLGSKSYRPFMTLDAAGRREVIEDLLDIGIYQSMYTILKKKVTTAQREKDIKESSLTEVVATIETNEQYLNRISGEAGKQHIRSVEESIENLKLEKAENEKTLDSYLNDDHKDKAQKAVKALNEIESGLKKLNNANATMRTKLSSEKQNKNFFEQNDICPTCHQDIDDEIKSREVDKNESEINKLTDYLDKCDLMIEDKSNSRKELRDLIQGHEDALSEIKFIRNEIDHIEQNIRNKETVLSDLKNKTASDIEFIQEKNKESLEKQTTLSDEIAELNKQLNSYQYISTLLKDDGIKQQIVQTYIPLINKLIRKFLDIMEFNVDFRFDESFKETIKARGRDDYTYGNFSEGEKLRIDLCLLFTWRELSRMKNSAATNLLILDEIGESSLDETGFDCFMKILKSEQSNQCSIIISHRPEKIEPYVHRVYNFKKVGNFSDMTVRDGKSIERTVI